MYLASISWASVLAALSLALRYSFTPHLINVSGSMLKFLDTLSSSSLVSAAFEVFIESG